MNYVVWCCLLLVSTAAYGGGDERIFLLSKRQIVNSTHTLVVLFYDRSIDSVSDCQRDIQRGYQGQWRYYTHSFPRPQGYSQNIDYHCVKAPIRVGSWYEQDPYDYVYQIDIRTETPKIRLMKHYADCLNDLRKQVRDETRKFFCAKSSQVVSF